MKRALALPSASCPRVAPAEIDGHGDHDLVPGSRCPARPDLPRGEVLPFGALDALEPTGPFVKAASPGAP
jgi:hypothetical protein